MDNNKPKVTEEEWRHACFNDEGWCTTCRTFTGDCVEPDAERYRCPVCEQRTLYGADQSLLLEHFELIE